MRATPPAVAAFLRCKHVAVAGVSRSGQAPANAILRRLRQAGLDAVPINPNATEVEGRTCYPSLDAVPGPIEAVMVVTPASAAAAVAQAAIGRGVRHIWFHRSFGTGSVSPEALAVCRAGGIEPIEGGCPLMYCAPVDPGHRVFRWWLRLRHRVPG
jgi:predicted CoA-binding protein